MKKTDTGSAPELPFLGLVAFEATARHGSVSKAADELNLSQSAVSQRILKLEAHVGQRLFLRHGHGVRLTGAGDLLVQTARDTLHTLQAGLARIEPYRNKASLLLACPPDFAHGWLMPRMTALKALHASLEVWLFSDHDITGIDRIDVDLVIARKSLAGDEVEAVPLLADRAIAIGHPHLAQRLRDQPYPKVLEKAPLLFLESDPEWGGLLPDGARIRRGETIQDERLLLEAVEHGLGLAYASEVLASGALAAGRVERLQQVPATTRAPLWMMRSRLTPRTPMANRAFDWFVAQAQSLAC